MQIPMDAFVREKMAAMSAIIDDLTTQLALARATLRQVTESMAAQQVEPAVSDQ